MGANPTQAQGVVLFMIGCIVICAGLAANVNYLILLLGVALVAAATALFVKCKTWEYSGEDMRLDMILLGVVITLLGFVISVLSLGMTSSVGGRLAMVLIGIATSLVGIMGVLNRAYLKNANWRKSHPL